jgi:hypothetical protein
VFPDGGMDAMGVWKACDGSVVSEWLLMVFPKPDPHLDRCTCGNTSCAAGEAAGTGEGEAAGAGDSKWCSSSRSTASPPKASSRSFCLPFLEPSFMPLPLNTGFETAGAGDDDLTIER